MRSRSELLEPFIIGLLWGTVGQSVGVPLPLLYVVAFFIGLFYFPVKYGLFKEKEGDDDKVR